MQTLMNNHVKPRIPKEDPYYYINNETLGILDKVHKISAKHPINILVAGRQGCGKSSLVRQYAAVYERPLATFQVGILSEPGQLFGEYALENGETRYKQFLFPQAIQTPGCVIHLEEINRPENPKALNMLFSLLSDDRQVWMDELGLLDVAEGVVFFATLNEGDEFIGTELLDPALRDRFYIHLMDYLPNEVEKEILIKKTGVSQKQAGEILDVVNTLRSNSELPVEISTRTTLMIGEMIAAEATLREAISISLQTNKETLESILISLHMEKGLLEKGNADFLLFTKNVVQEYAQAFR
ncbi:AAA family ATPase [Desulfobacula toluolica]|uniref:BssE: chaperone associated with benzylsuccinate synthase n=1 Tax=Desulfobacula toluolica (strain DSM 7467 / Tol2) TaxID=651182 RepID=K0NF59_DESTT|nr:AAA family ATPase [Desulfobacula toluolica]CCK78308.1 BssE: chaperone associated with benzylsuccinate synthase [Desulfobacula toluolica Tol2]